MISITTHGVSYDQLVGDADKHEHTNNNNSANQDLFSILLRVNRALIIAIQKRRRRFTHRG